MISTGAKLRWFMLVDVTQAYAAAPNFPCLCRSLSQARIESFVSSLYRCVDLRGLSLPVACLVSINRLLWLVFSCEIYLS
jgi:hypothetical protein